MTTTTNPDTVLVNHDWTRCALRLALDKATDMADSLLRVPMDYYNHR